MAVSPFVAHKTDEPELVQLYFDRNEDAIRQTEQRYGTFCYRIALNILRDIRDAQECEQDAYLRVWQSIPPTVPKSFRAYLGRITRNLALSLWRSRRAEKRDDASFLLSQEVVEMLPSGEDPAAEVFLGEMCQTVARFLNESPKDRRVFFLQRYWYGMNTEEIARLHHCTDMKVRSTLSRMRKDLRQLLEMEGYGYDDT